MGNIKITKMLTGVRIRERNKQKKFLATRGAWKSYKLIVWL